METEARNPASTHLDTLDTADIVQVILDEDRTVAAAVAAEKPAIVAAAELMTRALQGGGRLLYVGSGTSGRLGVLDAVELMPTFGVGEEQVRAILAGGSKAMFCSVEETEDDFQAGAADVLTQNPGRRDVVVGITASGRTPYVLGALQAAKGLGTAAVALTCNRNTAVAKHADVTIAVVVGPEVITGSTRMKAGTAQKMVLNALSTAVMVRLGKVFQNYMVDMQPYNAKLRRRAVRIVSEAAEISAEEAERVLSAADWNIKTALVMEAVPCSKGRAEMLLEAHDGFVSRVIASERRSAAGKHS